MEASGKLKQHSKMKKGVCLKKFIPWLASLFFVFFVFHAQSPLNLSYPEMAFLPLWKGEFSPIATNKEKFKAAVTFLPLKDLRFSQTPMQGNTWFMSSLNDTVEDGESDHMYFPSPASQGRILCLKGRDSHDGTNNSYALAWKDSLPDSAILLDGLTFVSDTYYDHLNLWHGIGAAVPFVRWSMKNGCARPNRWVLFHWGELRFKMGSWLEQMMAVYFGNVKVEGFEEGNGRPYCFEKALVVRHDTGSMSVENKMKVFSSLRCKARSFCGFREREIDVKEVGAPLINMTLLMRRGSRSFKNPTVVAEVFAKECAKVEGCIFNIIQSEDLNFCNQVSVMSSSDIVASPHGAQLTNMFFMDRNSSVMEFFPKGWREYAGPGQYAHHWMAHQSGMNHRGAWWDSLVEGENCPDPTNELQCFLYHKDGKVGHNATYFAQWTRKVLREVKHTKLQEATKYHGNQHKHISDACSC